ncbi:hypothetical protein Vadar_025410 [Vaccinium darrowii]|uniref:Uncharacterized protein n=1 Tax=Vaccinium darrowii TaxID=229202 RepID=A0ACB7XCG3_9ERIC|nr:hypothetical protein Vadar_025410 [Vaccinium darrowii]
MRRGVGVTGVGRWMVAPMRLVVGGSLSNSLVALSRLGAHPENSLLYIIFCMLQYLKKICLLDEPLKINKSFFLLVHRTSYALRYGLVSCSLGRYLQKSLAMVATLCGPSREILETLSLEGSLTADEKYVMIEQVMVDVINQVGLDVKWAISP